MGRYTLEGLKKDLARLAAIKRDPIGFTAKPVGKERKAIKDRIKSHGFDLEVQSHVWVSLKEEEE